MIPNVQSAIKGAPLDSFIDRTPPSSTSAQLAVLQWDHIRSISIGSLIGDLLQPTKAQQQLYQNLSYASISLDALHKAT